MKQLVHPVVYPKVPPPNNPKVIPGMFTHVEAHQTLMANATKQLVHYAVYPEVLPPQQA